MKTHYENLDYGTLFNWPDWDREQVAKIMNKLFPNCKITRVADLIIYDKEMPIPKTWRNLFGLIKNITQKQNLRYRIEFQLEAQEIKK